MHDFKRTAQSAYHVMAPPLTQPRPGTLYICSNSSTAHHSPHHPPKGWVEHFHKCPSKRGGLLSDDGLISSMFDDAMAGRRGGLAARNDRFRRHEGISPPVRLAMDVALRITPSSGSVVSASFLNAKPVGALVFSRGRRVACALHRDVSRRGRHQGALLPRCAVDSTWSPSAVSTVPSDREEVPSTGRCGLHFSAKVVRQHVDPSARPVLRRLSGCTYLFDALGVFS
jgi:hypothetical protein